MRNRVSPEDRCPAWIVLGLLVAWSLLPGRPAQAAGPQAGGTPFHKGERLSYQVLWSFIPAARVSLEVVSDEAAVKGAAYHFVMNAKTLPVVDLIYKYQERIDSYVAADLQHSLLYKKLKGGSHPRDVAVHFDWDTGVARYVNFGKAIDPIPIQPSTLDPLAAFYYIRAQGLTDQIDLERWVTDGKKLSKGRARFVGKEALSIRGKTYQTIKVEPDLRDVKGVFEKSPGATMFIWLTDDERKLLVKLKSKVVVGSFVAELIEEESVIPASDGSLPSAQPAQ